jgi:tripeptide aminopeptidase
MPLGRIDDETTANFGVIKGGIARNIIPDRVELRGEARSRNVAKLEAQTAVMKDSLQAAAERHGATVDVEIAREYDGYTLSEKDAIISELMAACRAVGVEPSLVPTGGGSDANIFSAAGIQVANLTTGMSKVHTTEECIAVADMVICAEIVLSFIRNLAA